MAFFPSDVPADFPAGLAGLLTAGGYYDAATWKKRTGIDPADYPRYFYERAGFLFCTPEYRTDYAACMAQLRRDYAALGVKS